MKKTIQERRLAFLQEMIDFYSVDPKGRRAVNELGGCRYRTEDGRKCAIGRHIPDEKYTPEIENTGVCSMVLMLLPNEIQELDMLFLSRVQSLHDDTSYWETDGLSSEGLDYVEKTKEEFCS